MSQEKFLINFRKSSIIFGVAVLFVALLFGLSKISTPNKLSLLPTIKSSVVTQFPSVPGQPIKWVKTVKASNISDKEHILVVPGIANDIKIATSTKENVSFSKIPKLTNADRLKLQAEATERINSEASIALAQQIERQKAKGFFASITRFFSGVGSMFATVGESMNSSGKKNSDVVLVDLASITDAGENKDKKDEAENKDKKEKKDKEDKKVSEEIVPVEISEVILPEIEQTEEVSTTTLLEPTEETLPETERAEETLSELTSETLPEAEQDEEMVSTSSSFVIPVETGIQSSSSTLDQVEATSTPIDEIINTTTEETEQVSTSTDIVTVEYETPAPVFAEAKTVTGKIVQISAPDPVTDPEATSTEQITDVLAFTNIPEIYKVGQESKIKIKWTNEGNREVDFRAYDLDGNGKLDYVEWTVPHLSTQTFEIIFISKAFQLDTDLTILEDIFDTVRTRDNTFAPITDGQYIRVTFEKILDNTKDITVYARPHFADGSAGQASIEVYPVYTDTEGNQTQGSKLTLVSDGVNPTFENIDHDGKYRILLQNLQEQTDVFDLKITGDIDVDYIVDPTGLVAHYKMDDTNGTTVVDNIAGNNGTGTYTASSTGKIDGAVSFDSSVTDMISIPDLTSEMSGDFTFAFWYYQSDWSAINNHIFNHTSDGDNSVWAGFYANSGSLTFRVNIGEDYGLVTYDVSSLSSGWHYLSGTYDATSGAGVLYINGVNVGNFTQSGFTWAGPTNLTSLASYGSGGFSTGDFDDVRIYDVALDQSDIEALYQGGTGTQQDVDLGLGLVGYWKLDDNAATTAVVDSSGNSYTGTASANTDTMDTEGKLSGALSFGGNKHVDIPDMGAQGNNFSFSAWVNLPSEGDKNYAILASDSWAAGSFLMGMRINSPASYIPEIFVDVNGMSNEYAHDAKLSTGVWQHAVWTHDETAGVSKIYINGALTSTFVQQFTGAYNMNWSDANIGRFMTQDLSGSLDDVRIYNRALRPAEITELYNSTAGTEEQWLQNDGIVTTDGADTVVTYYSSGTFTPPEGVTEVEALVVGGGGGGGQNASGGGGGGGYQYNASVAVSAQTYNVVVGAGGAGASSVNNDGIAGSPSSFSTITANGGGYGGGALTNGGNGGSGGGGGTINGLGGTGNQGYDGGDGVYSDPHYAGGGGGGAGGIGADAIPTKGGDGGIGLQNSISGSTVYYAGGGGGGFGAQSTPGTGGLGGGGAGGVAGVPNTGGGGGGDINGTSGKAGGSGIVILRYLTPVSNTAPSATFDNDFATWTSGDVTVNYNLIDADEDTLNISQTATSGIEYSTDNSNWYDATEKTGGLSEGLTGLTSSADPGTGHVFIWDSATDLPTTEDSTVYLRIRPNDGTVDADDWVTSSAFGIDNVAPTGSEGSVEVLVVAGGGGGGATLNGGGGAGGLIYNDSYEIGVGSISVVVGAGGAGGAVNEGAGANGQNSSFDTLIALGGGGSHGVDGGNGGGGSRQAVEKNTGGTGLQPASESGGFGNNGGDCPGNDRTSGGGGGAGAVGGTATTIVSGNGGDGLQYSISGTATYYAGGGGGGARTDLGGSTPGTGGLGGGGDGKNNAAGVAGVANTGGGGGSGGYNGSYKAGGNGGSGIVIIRYATANLTATGGTITTDGLYTIHTFTSNGTFEITATNSLPAPTFGTIATDSIVVNQPSGAGDTGSGLAYWMVRRGGATESDWIATTTTTYSSESLSANTQYTYDVRFKDTAGNISSYGTSANKYTLANTPNAPTVNTPTVTTINVNPVTGGAETTMAIYAEQGATCDGAGGLGYVQANGSISASAVWQSDATWSTVTVTGLTGGTQYSFCAKAKNGDATETAFGSASSGTTTNPPNVPTLVSPANASLTADNTPTLSAVYSDPDADDVGTTNYRISSGTAQNCLDGVSIANSGTSTETVTNNATTTYTPASTIGSDGTYYWCAQNNDGEATSAWTSMGNFVLDTTAPVVTVTSPTNGFYSTSTSVSFAASQSDTNAGFLVPNLDSSLVSWWRMEDNAANTTVTDYMGANNGASVQNTSAVHTIGKFGSAMTFNGTTDKIIVSGWQPSTGTQVFTGNIWFRTSSQTDMVLFSWGKTIPTSQIFLRTYYGNGGLVYNDRTDYTRNYCDGNWHMATAIYDGTNIKLYVDNILTINVAAPFTSISDYYNNLRIGTHGGDNEGIEYYNGDIDDVMFFNRVLTTDEITALYNGTAISHSSTLSEASHTYRAYSSDLAGNVTASAFSTFTVDATAPNSATSLVWSESSPASSTSVTASWTKSNSADLNNQKIQFYTGASCNTVSGSLIDLASNSVQTRAFTGVDATTYTYKITSIDTATNETVSACSAPLSIDTSRPIISSILPATTTNITNYQLITFSTNEVADCRLSTAQESYDDMSDNVSCSVTEGILMSCISPDLGGAGIKNIYLACSDALGNKDTADSATHLAYTLILTGHRGSTSAVAEIPAVVAPVYSISINNGSSGTTERVVNLKFSATPSDSTSATVISTSPDFSNTLTIPFNNLDYQFDLCQGKSVCPDGLYTVYARFLDPTGVPSSAISSSINLNAVPLITEVTNNITNIITNIITPVIPQNTETIIYPPIEQSVPQEAQETFKNNWDIAVPTSLDNFIFENLPNDVQTLINKFPEVGTTLQKVGITRMSDVSDLIGVGRISLPNLSETLGFSSGQRFVLANLTSQQVNQIPTNVIFAKTASEDIDLNTSISISNAGLALQTLNTIQGQPLKFVVRPESKAEKVSGYMIFRSTKTSAIKLKQTSSIIDATNIADEPSDVDFVLNKFDYVDSGNGVWTAEVSSPLALGQYELKTVVDYKEKTKVPKTISMVVVVDPEGYVYKVSGGDETRISNALVSIFWLNPKTNEYELWPASNFRQTNPQTTDVTGRYAFLVPPGEYYLEVKADGYSSYKSEPFKVEESKGMFMNIEMKTKWSFFGVLSLQTLLLGMMVVMLGWILTVTIRKRKSIL